MKRIMWLLLPVFVFTASEVVAVEEWAARYNGAGNSFDWSSAIAVDKTGNIYVTGGSQSSSLGWDYATIKYDAAGNQKWVRRYNGNYGSGGSSRVDFARAIAVDNEANVYVTGDSSGENGWIGYLTVKYDSNGTYQWRARYKRGTYSNSHATSMALDPGGNVYVTGYTYDVRGATSYDITTVKYDRSGVQKWVRHYMNPVWDVDEKPVAIAVDVLGNAYVAGYSPGKKVKNGVIITTPNDFVLIKYNTAGTLQWVQRYDGPGHKRDEAKGLKVVSRRLYDFSVETNVYVTGYSVGEATQGDYATIKYDGAGDQKWVRRYNGQPESFPNVSPAAVGVDGAGNVYVTGSGVCPSEYMTLKYNRDGVWQWTRRFHMGRQWDIATAMAVDNAGNVYVTGQSQLPGAPTFDIVTIKYDTNGSLQWTEQYDGPGNDYDEPFGIAVDTSGNVYVTGYSVGDGTHEDYVTLKYPAK